MKVVLRCLTVLALAGAGCRVARAPATPGVGPILAPPDIATLIDGHVKDREAWGQAVAVALRASALPADPPSVCAVLAIVGQESTFQEDPVVPGLARLVEARLDRYRSKLGPLGKPVFSRLLAGHSPHDPRPFDER